MKITSRDGRRFCAEPSAEVSGFLLYGPDQGLVAARRSILLAALTASAGGEPVRIDAADARRSPADVDAALRTQGFFGGRPVVLIEGGTDGLARGLAPIVEGLTPEDGVIIVTADVLPARSSLRKLFERSRGLAAISLFPEVPNRGEIEALLAEMGVERGLADDAAADLARLAAEMDYGGFLKLLESLSIYSVSGDGPISAADVAAVAPMGLEGDLDRFVAVVANGEVAALGSSLRRLAAGGATVVSIVLALQRHFRMLLSAAASGTGIEGLRPPLYGPRRDQVARQLRSWHRERLEQANRLLFETDARLRSTERMPDLALVERTALRLAIMAGR